MKFKQETETIVCKNPFKTIQCDEFVYKMPYVFRMQGGFIIRAINAIEEGRSQYDYFVGDRLVTQRAGASEEVLKKLIEYDAQAGDYTLFNQISKEIKDKAKCES